MISYKFQRIAYTSSCLSNLPNHVHCEESVYHDGLLRYVASDVDSVLIVTRQTHGVSMRKGGKALQRSTGFSPSRNA